MPDDTPFFIIGAGRSGTTLLRLILAGHSRLHIPPETRFVHALVYELPLTGALTPTQIERAVAIMTGDYRWPDMDMRADDLRQQATALQEPALVDVIDLVYRHHLLRAGKQRFGDKTPMYFTIVPQLATLYPGAKFIHLIRDGRDVAISRLDLDWDRYYQRSGFEWTQAMAKRQELRASPYAGQILEVRYEDLVGDLAGTVRQVCAFLGERFEPAVMDWHHLTTLLPVRERHIHAKLAQPVSTQDIAVWRKRLSAAECFAVEACLHRDLEQAGYQLRFSGAMWRPFLMATGGLLHVAAPWLERGVRALKRRKLMSGRICL